MCFTCQTTKYFINFGMSALNKDLASFDKIVIQGKGPDGKWTIKSKQIDCNSLQ